MQRVIKIFGLLCFFGYMFFLVSGGLVGFFAPRYELGRMYHIDLAGLNRQDLSSLFDDLRFLKAYVLGFAAFAIIFRREIFTVRRYNCLFLGTLFLSACGRLVTVLLAGRPAQALNSYMIAEFVFGFGILAYSRITLAAAEKRQA